MRLLRNAMSLLGLGGRQENEGRTEHQRLMQSALNRIHMAELQLREATSLEELDIARSAILSGHAEVQQLIRTVKRDRGITVRSIAETEELFRNMREFINHRTEPGRTSVRRKTGTER